ncbi:MAG: sodium:proton antiporter NhaD [Bacteroidia bacterium]|nr:sodium:proton antiporter NhaD [Bacteroidia bacterium]
MHLIIISIFILGYLAIAFEHSIKINKTATALLTGVFCWTVYILFGSDKHLITEQLTGHLGELSGILFFLMGAMTIVELIDAHDGFDIITTNITTLNKRKLLWIICFITFILSALLDNLTTAIVMVSLLRKLIDNREDRLFFIGMVIIAANAGGAWSPIGDVTTTMLWIGGQVSASNIIAKLIAPSLICLIVPLIIASFKLKGNITKSVLTPIKTGITLTLNERNIIFFTGLGGLIFVPVFKTITHLPPFMGVLLSLGILWVVTEMIHSQKDEEEKDALSVVHALRRIDVPSILFFLGILIAIAALQSTGQLATLAQVMNERIGNLNIIVPAIGLLSAIVDNVPLVAASMGMYDLTSYPTDSYIWEFLAYCAGTGGSILIIGSAAGVAAMGMERIDFMWYLKKIAWLAAIGYFAGALCYMLQEYIFYS